MPENEVSAIATQSELPIHVSCVCRIRRSGPFIWI